MSHVLSDEEREMLCEGLGALIKGTPLFSNSSYADGVRAIRRVLAAQALIDRIRTAAEVRAS